MTYPPPPYGPGGVDPAGQGYLPAQQPIQPFSAPPDPYAYPPVQYPYPPAQYSYQQPMMPVPMMPVVPVVPFVQVAIAPTSGMAVASLVLGIVGVVVGWCTFGIASLLAIIFGHLGLAETRDGRVSGRGNAIAGLVLGYVAIAPMIYFAFAYYNLVGHTTTAFNP